jgi:orotidine-5'-phosphate decarboxylase
MSLARNPILVALDTPSTAAALDLAGRLKGKVGGVKLGLEFFGANGPEGVRRVAQLGMPVFLDLKFHDIPNTVAGAVRSVLPLSPLMMNVHASGGLAMMRAARQALEEAPHPRPVLLAVTILTSLDQNAIDEIGYGAKVADQVTRLAELAQRAGLDGVVCSPQEVAVLRQKLGTDFQLVVPGIRPAWAEAGDQKRVMTPKEAVAAGASWIVIGRPITAAADPVVAAERILAELDGPG